MTIKRQIIAMGGGGFSMETTPLLDEYVLSASDAATPRVCFFPHATDDAIRYVHNFYAAFSKLNCKPTHLSLFSSDLSDVETLLLSQDVIYVGGGNTKSMLALWREWHLDQILRKAYERGIVLAGISAGANCWFQSCSTDSYNDGTLRALPALGFLRGAYCPHYDGEALRRPTLRRMVGTGEMEDAIACDDGAAAHFVNGVLSEVVSSRPHALGYRVTRTADNEAVEVALATRYLGKL